MGNEKINQALTPFIVDIDTLVLDPENLNKHPEHNLSAIKKSISEFGQQKPHVVYHPDTMVVSAGNGVVMAARSLGWTKIAAVPTDIKDALNLKLFAIADNQIPRTSVLDWEGISQFFQDIDLDAMPDVDLTITGLQDFEIEPLLLAEWEPPPIDGSESSDGPGGEDKPVTWLVTKDNDERAKEIIKEAKDAGKLDDDMPMVDGLLYLAWK